MQAGIAENVQMWVSSSVGRASDRQAADTGSIPRYGEVFFFFFLQSQLSVQTLLHGVPTASCAIACNNICAHVKDPVVHVRVR